MRLTERNLATGVTKNDLMHIVITGDTTDSPEGSSYKARVGQLLELYDLPVPLVKLQSFVSGTTVTVNTLNNNNTVGDPITLINPPYITLRDVSIEQINHGVFIEMVQYKMKSVNNKPSKFKRNGGGFVVEPRMENNGVGGVRNGLQYDIMSLYGKVITTRGGVQKRGANNLAVNRMNHYKVQSLNEIYNLSDYFSGRYSYRTIGYTNDGGDPDSLGGVPIPFTNASKNTSDRMKKSGNGTPYEICYNGVLTSLYVAFRYLMFDPDSNEGKGKFIEGPLSQTIKVSNKYFPFIKIIEYGNCLENPMFDEGFDLIKFRFV